MEHISKDADRKDRLGTYKRHALTDDHPSSATHELVEHTNEERGDGYRELVPRVV
jgi:hypothetical protein